MSTAAPIVSSEHPTRERVSPVGVKLSWVAGLGLLLLAVFAANGLAATVRPGLGRIDSNWRGAPLESLWIAAPVSAAGSTRTTLGLHIWLRGDDLSASYTLATGRDPSLVREVSDYPASLNGHQFVTSVLGTVRFSEQRYGVSGDALYWTGLAFSPPVLEQAGTTTTVLVSSAKVRVDLSHLYFSIARSQDLPAAATEKITVTSSSGRITDVSGASFAQIKGHSVVLSVPLQTTPLTPPTAAFVLTDGHSSWLTGLRAAGQIALPTAANNLLIRLAQLLAYGVLLWALTRIVVSADEGAPLARITQAVALIVTGLAVLDVLGAAVDLTFLVKGHPQSVPPEVAGPLGLLVGLVFVAWPAAAFRFARVTVPNRPSRPRARILVLLASACSLTGLAYVLYVREVLQISSGTVIMYTAVVCFLACGLAIYLPRTARHGAIQLLVIPCLLAALLSTIFWPILSAAYITHGGISVVNYAGKWLYLLLVVAITGGLGVIGVRVGGAVIAALTAESARHRELTRKDKRRRRIRLWVWGCAWCALVTGLIVPSAIKDAALAHPHLAGLHPASLIAGTNLIDALPELLDWVLLGLAATALATLPQARPDGITPAADMSRAIRLTGIAMFAILLCQGGRWMYLPLSLLAGYLALRYLAMPIDRVLDGVTARPRPAALLGRALASWRDLEFVTSQQQSIATDSAGALRDVLIKEGARSYNRSLRAVARSQSRLGRRRDQLRLAARDATSRVFDHEGLAPSAGAARTGLITGCVFAIVPALVLALSSKPPGQVTDYPALDLLGQAAWTVVLWPFLGWCVGYFLPYLKGDNGVKKALWLYLAVLLATLPRELIYNDGPGWISALVFDLELLAFLLICTVVTCEFLVLKEAGLRITDWTKVHNWRFVVTWSSTVLAALGTAAATFLSTAATDLGQQAVPIVSVQTPTSSSATHTGSGP